MDRVKPGSVLEHSHASHEYILHERGHEMLQGNAAGKKTSPYKLSKTDERQNALQEMLAGSYLPLAAHEYILHKRGHGLQQENAAGKKTIA
ncbi:hypothetical protein HNY73_006567 [Argiope bruennichi]|uniref:Uncharacterized protein n=1 Tax=Argiope bruennichi TaxID=94029 RepID=A0A8T0FBJ9_ARGBR|nr:hypothetical protein HNY73_006567 [Argiope bruennichi]